MDPKNKVRKRPFSPTHCVYIFPTCCRRFPTWGPIPNAQESTLFHQKSYSKDPNHALENVLTNETPGICVFLKKLFETCLSKTWFACLNLCFVDSFSFSQPKMFALSPITLVFFEKTLYNLVSNLFSATQTVEKTCFTKWYRKFFFVRFFFFFRNLFFFHLAVATLFFQSCFFKRFFVGNVVCLICCSLLFQNVLTFSETLFKRQQKISRSFLQNVVETFWEFCLMKNFVSLLSHFI